MKLSELEYHDIEDADDNDDSYEREKKVSLLILRAFRKCGLKVAEHESTYSGVRDHDDSWGYDVLYSEDDHEATVTLEEAELRDLVKLHASGLIDGDCQVMATSDMTLRLTFKVHPNLHSGDAKISESTDDLVDRLANDIKLNWMSMDEEELVEFLKDADENWMSYLKGMKTSDLEDLVSQAYYQAHN